MNPQGIPFMRADWRHILYVNYAVDPTLLARWLPAGTRLDLWGDTALVSLQCLQSFKTRVMGLAMPLHTRFDRISLCLYVQREVKGEVRHGVVKLREFTPRWWISELGRVLYGEKTQALPIQHTIEMKAKNLATGGLVEYTWVHRRKRSRVGGLAVGEAFPIVRGSQEAFVCQRPWGYVRRSAHWSGEYALQHADWRIRPLTQPYLLSDIAPMFGRELTPYLHHAPYSAFVAEGSPTTLYLSHYFHA